MTRIPRRIFTAEFKKEAINLVLEQGLTLTEATPTIDICVKHVVVDLGFRGVDADNPNVQIIHKGKYKSLSAQQKKWLRRRSAVEPAIGHLKSDHRLDRCWLKGALGDALHCISCAAGYNVRWLLRAIAAKGIKPFAGLSLRQIILAMQALLGACLKNLAPHSTSRLI